MLLSHCPRLFAASMCKALLVIKKIVGSCLA